MGKNRPDTGVRIVPKPKPEYNVRREAKKATRPMMISMKKEKPGSCTCALNWLFPSCTGYRKTSLPGVKMECRAHKSSIIFGKYNFVFWLKFLSKPNDYQKFIRR
jgi:hypothetical protein